MQLRIGVYACLLVACLCAFGFSLDILDDLHIAEIRSMQFYEQDGTSRLDTVIAIRNTSSMTLQLRNCDFHIALALEEGGEDIPLGATHVDEIFLPPYADSPETIATMELSVEIESDIEEFQARLFSSPKILSLLTAADPALPIKLQGTFDFGMQGAQSWSFKEGMKIDWMVSPAIQKQVLAQAVSQLAANAGGTNPLQAVSDESASVPAVVEHAAADDGSALSENFELSPQAQPDPEGLENPPVTSVPQPDERDYSVTVLFASGSIRVDRDSRKTLQRWAEHLPENLDGMALHITGHTDKNGTPQNNQIVSVKRAKAVFHYVVDALEVTQFHQYCIEGLAFRQPVIDDNTPEANTKNRRVEMFVVKTTKD